MSRSVWISTCWDSHDGVRSVSRPPPARRSSSSRPQLRIYESDEARAALKKHADDGDQIEELGERRRVRMAQVGIAHPGGLPADL